MSTYNPPLKDMAFALHELVNVAELSSLPAWQDVTPELVESVLAEAGKFAREILDPLNKVGDVQGARLTGNDVTAPQGYADAYRKFVDAGWNSLTGDPAFGASRQPKRLVRVAPPPTAKG